MLTVLGATGYTGRLCAAEAVRAGLEVRLAGRRIDALEALASELGAAEVAVADVADRDGLHSLARSTAVLLTTVGPYARLGRGVVEAAVSGGCHYLDVSGEVGFLQWAYEQDERAAAAGVALCPGFGFDGVPGELLAALAAAGLDGAGLDGARVRVAYLVRGAWPSRGTVRSALGVLAAGPRQGESWAAPFPSPLGTQSTVPVPLPEEVTIPRALGVADVRTYGVLRGGAPVRLLARPAARAARLIATTPAWRLVEMAADRLPEGPSDHLRLQTRAAVLVEVEAAGGSRRAWVRLTDMYGTTARIAVAAARRLLDAPPGAGALPPSAVVGDPGRFLADIGGVWEHIP